LQINKIKYLSLLDKAGIFRLSKTVSKNQIRILTYHRFGEGYVSSEVFEKHVIYLTKYFNIISLSSYLDFLNGQKKLPPNSVILTVDDGYMDFFSFAFPTLKKYKTPATVFLTVDFIDNGMWLWHDLLNYGINSTSRKDITFNGRIFDLTNQVDKSALKLLLDNICTSIGTTERDIFSDHFLKELKVSVPEHPTPDYAPLTWDKIIEMSEFGISYGAHTCTHPILSKIAPHEALKEIRDSKQHLEAVVQKDILAFCYPNGTEKDFNEDIKKMVKECGYFCAMSMIYGMNDLKSDRYALRRMHANSSSFVHFIQDVSGFGLLRRSLRKGKRKFT
jgi:peptidoglycan/xylan/chitin deacetylase (PgdA/CDA1 family)